MLREQSNTASELKATLREQSITASELERVLTFRCDCTEVSNMLAHARSEVLHSLALNFAHAQSENGAVFNASVLKATLREQGFIASERIWTFGCACTEVTNALAHARSETLHSLALKFRARSQ